MNASTEKIVEAIANDIIVLFNLIMESDTVSINRKVNKNTLRESALKNDVEKRIQLTDNPVIEILFDNYITFLKWDRPPKYGKQPPVDSLRDWALNNGIPTDNDTLFLIARAIWRDGHEGRPILATLENEIAESFENEYFDKLFESIIEQIIKFFN